MASKDWPKMCFMIIVCLGDNLTIMEMIEAHFVRNQKGTLVECLNVLHNSLQGDVCILMMF